MLIKRVFETGERGKSRHHKEKIEILVKGEEPYKWDVSDPRQKA